MKRGGGRRYYRPEDVDILRQIRGLLYDDGYTIKGVQKLFREGGKSALKASAVVEDAPTENTHPVMDDKVRLELKSILVELEELRAFVGY